MYIEKLVVKVDLDWRLGLGLSVLELSELVNEISDTFGIKPTYKRIEDEN